MNALAPIHPNVVDTGRKVSMVRLIDIDVGKRHREVKDEAVAALATSMEQIGLRTPISVGLSDDCSEMWLITGAHRLAAARRLGWDQIECIIYMDSPDEIDAELWEIAENLHRAELTKYQRDEHIRRYAELLAERAKKPPQIDAVSSKGGRGKKGVASKIAAETGLSKSTVERALNPERVAAERVRREAAAREREAQQAEFDRQQEESRKALPPHIQRIEEAKARNGATQAAVAGAVPTDIGVLEAERDELREENAALKADIADRDRRLALYDDMAVQWEKGGFEAVIATKDEQIRVLRRQVETESADKAAHARRVTFWRKQAIALGYVAPNSQVEEQSDELPADIAAGLPF